MIDAMPQAELRLYAACPLAQLRSTRPAAVSGVQGLGSSSSKSGQRLAVSGWRSASARSSCKGREAR